jgi:hypothetical protein
MKGVLLPIPAIECIGASHGHGQNQDIRCPLDAWFFGCLSVFVTLKTALALNPELTLIGQHNEPWLHHEPMVSENFTSQWQMPPQSALSALLRFFSGSINLFYPTVKDDQLNSLTASGSHQSDMTDQDQDIFFLILAISSKLVKAPAYVPPFASHVYFHKATYHPAKTRESWLQLDPLLLLQRQLLICIYLILSPASGDIWRNLGFAIRLYFDLSHRPSENDDTDEELMIMLFRTLYCLEWWGT